MIYYAIRRTDDGRYMQGFYSWHPQLCKALFLKSEKFANLMANDERDDGIPCEIIKVRLEEVEE